MRTRLEEIRTGSDLPSPKGIAIRVIELTRIDDVTNQEVAHAIKTIKRVATARSFTRSHLVLHLRICQATAP